MLNTAVEKSLRDVPLTGIAEPEPTIFRIRLVTEADSEDVIKALPLPGSRAPHLNLEERVQRKAENTEEIQSLQAPHEILATKEREAKNTALLFLCTQTRQALSIALD